MTTIVQSLRTLFAAYGQGKDQARAAAYVEMLSDLPPEQVAAAVRVLCCRGGRFLPTIAEIREVIAEAESGLPAVELAWGEVMAQVRRVGRYRVPRWTSQAIADAVAALGGWQAVCDADNEGVIRGQFAKAYRATRARDVSGRQLGAPALGGLSERLRLGGKRD